MGFEVTLSWSGTVSRYIGLTPVASPAGFRIRPERLGALDVALEDMGSQRTLIAQHLRSVLGVYIAYGLLWRPSISAPHATYKLAGLASKQMEVE